MPLESYSHFVDYGILHLEFDCKVHTETMMEPMEIIGDKILLKYDPLSVQRY